MSRSLSGSAETVDVELDYRTCVAVQSLLDDLDHELDENVFLDDVVNSLLLDVESDHVADLVADYLDEDG